MKFYKGIYDILAANNEKICDSHSLFVASPSPARSEEGVSEGTFFPFFNYSQFFWANSAKVSCIPQ